MNIFPCFVSASFCVCVCAKSFFLFVSTLPHWCVSSLVRALDGGQQQCVNPGHPRVRLSPSAIHCCLVFLPVSLLPPSPFEFFSFSFNAAPTFQICALLPGSGSSFCSCSQPPRENKNKKNRLEKQPPLAALRATYNADPLSKLLCSPFPLAPFPSLSPCYCWGRALSFSLFLLPLSRPSSTSNSYLVSHFSTCFEIERDREREEGTDRKCCSSMGECVQLKMCRYVCM